MLQNDFRGLTRHPLTEAPLAPDDTALAELAGKRSSRARGAWLPQPADPQVDAGSCNGCELEIHALNNAFYDLERFGCALSPRRAMPTCCW